MELIKFKDLEDKIKRLVQEHAAAKKRLEEVEELLRNRSLELEEVHNKNRALTEERNAVRAKVDSLLALLQDIKVPQA